MKTGYRGRGAGPFLKAGNRAAALLLSLLMILVSVLHCMAAESGGPDVIEADVGIRPSDYRKLVSDETEPVFAVQIASEGGCPLRAKIRLRGAASKGMGLAFPTKKVPLDFQLDPDDALARALGNSSVKLINSYTPFRLMAEYTALDLFRFAQVPVSEHKLLFLRFNGVDFGLYLALEELNGEFLAKHFPDGALYKADSVHYEMATSISSWFGCLRLTAGKDNGRLDELLKRLDAGVGYEELLDTDEILRFFACLAMYGADSTFLTEQNNFYLCDTGERFILLPWDNSEAFAGYETVNGIDHYRMDPWEDIDYPPPLFTLLMENEENRENYHKYLRQFNDGFLSQSAVDSYLNGLAAAAQPFFRRDATTFFNQPYELPLIPEETRYGTLNSLLGVFHSIHENIEAQLNGETDLFHMSSAYESIGAVFSMDDMQGIMKFMMENSPSADPDITERVCAAYSEWCRNVGKIPFDADDPSDIALCLIVFCAVFLLMIAAGRRGRVKKRPIRQQNKSIDEEGTGE